MKKKLLIITGLIVLIIALGGVWGYNKYFKPNPQVLEQLNHQFGSDFFNSFDTQNAVSNSTSVNTAQAANNLGEKSNVSDNNSKLVTTSEQDKSIIESVPPGDSSPERSMTLDEINNKYSPKFSYLQSVALSRLDTLFSAAVQEYVRDKKSGTLNRSQLAQKYIQAGTMLEGSVDKQFYNTLNAMQADLAANNLPTDIIGVKRNEYERAKSDKRSQLLAKAGK
jgi:hypothetical protein